MADDLYACLGVSKTASAEEIRKAYRKLSRENHPDVKKDDAEAAARFKKIQEAYGILGDPDKRAHYDRFGTFMGGGQESPFGRGSAGGRSAGPVDFGSFFGGDVDFGEFFGAATGRGGGRSAGTRSGGRRGAIPGDDIQAELSVPFETAASGGSVDIQIDRGGRTERLAVKVPAGVNEDSTIRLAGQGEPSPMGGPPGDLLLSVRIEPHRYFRREGNNLLVDVPITPSEAVLGTKVEVPTLNDGVVVLTVPPGTSSGMKLRLRGKGLIDPRTKQNGDQFVVIKIVVAPNLPDDARELYRQLQMYEGSPRQGLW